jgi:hypothetical protein
MTRSTERFTVGPVPLWILYPALAAAIATTAIGLSFGFWRLDFVVNLLATVSAVGFGLLLTNVILARWRRRQFATNVVPAAVEANILLVEYSRELASDLRELAALVGQPRQYWAAMVRMVFRNDDVLLPLIPAGRREEIVDQLRSELIPAMQRQSADPQLDAYLNRLIEHHLTYDRERAEFFHVTGSAERTDLRGLAEIGLAIPSLDRSRPWSSIFAVSLFLSVLVAEGRAILVSQMSRHVNGYKLLAAVMAAGDAAREMRAYLVHDYLDSDDPLSHLPATAEEASDETHEAGGPDWRRAAIRLNNDLQPLTRELPA